MSRVCDVCSKGPSSGNLRSHALNATRRRFLPNLQKVKANLKGEVKTIKVCTSCLKANKVIKVL